MTRLLLCHSLAVLGLLVASQLPAQRTQKPTRLEVTQGQSVRHTLSGTQYDALTSVRVLRGSRATRDVTATLGSPRRGSRTLTVQASARAKPGTDYRLEGLDVRRVATTLPIQLVVVAAAPAAPTPTQSTTPTRTIRPSPEPAAKMAIGRGMERWFALAGTRYAKLTDARVLRDSKATLKVKARVEQIRSRQRVVVAVAPSAALGDYQLQVKVGGQWQDVAMAVSVSAGPPVETVNLPDGTVVTLGPSRRLATPKPVVSGWQPSRVAQVGGTVTITGQVLPADAVVRIGSTVLDIASHAPGKIVAQLPATSDECPPGTLAVYAKNGTLIRECRKHYFVKGDKPFHHFERGTTEHEWINSYLLALMSLHVYHLGSWQEFREDFRNKVRPLGMNAFGFAFQQTSKVDTEVAIAANPELIVIVVRGSEGKPSLDNLSGTPGWWQDWVKTDFNLLKKNVNAWKEGAWVHTGIYDAWQEVHAKVEEEIARLRDNGQKVFVCGHSLGGSVATMGAYRMTRDKIPIQGVYTYASMRVGNAYWKAAYTDVGLQARTQRWSNKFDIVPRYPGMVSPGWEHVGKTNNIFLDNTIKLDDVEITKGTWQGSHHAIIDYIHGIHVNLPSSIRPKVAGAK